MKSASKSNAGNLRKSLTDAERKLWSSFQNHGLGNFKFRRQEPVGKYIADFVCYEKRLIIELDGGQHAEQQEKDEARTNWLESQGFRVLRLWNNEVLNETEAVVQVILNELEEEPRFAPSPQPSPARGERAYLSLGLM